MTVLLFVGLLDVVRVAIAENLLIVGSYVCERVYARRGNEVKLPAVLILDIIARIKCIRTAY